MDKHTSPDKKITSTGSFLQTVKNAFGLKLFFLKRLPMAFIAGLQVPNANENEALVTVSLGYLTKNPFRSVYFACLAMAAELSTGILAMNAIEQSGYNFSVLVVGLQANFTKKATGKITFQCNQGAAMVQTIQKCLENKEAGKYSATSIGKNEAGETVAEFTITWSFKPRTNK